jgi:hypothetical protein
MRNEWRRAVTVNRSTKGQYLPGGSPGRPKGARNRLAARVFEDIFAHWCEPAAPGGNMCKGQEALEALEALYKEKPGVGRCGLFCRS